MENVEMKEQIILNGKTMNVEEFETEKKSLFEKKIQIVEISMRSHSLTVGGVF